jgi:hypothetical protein
MSDDDVITSKKSNDTELFNGSDINEIVSSVIKAKKGSRRDKFFLYRFFNLPMEICARLSGYSLSYCYKLSEKYQKDSKLQESFQKLVDVIPDRYRELCKIRLMEMGEIEGRALAEYKKDPQLAIRQPQLLKQLKEAAGILNEADTTVQMVQLNFNDLQKHMADSLLRDPPAVLVPGPPEDGEDV